MTSEQRESFKRIHETLTAMVEREGSAQDTYMAILAYATSGLSCIGETDHEILRMTILALEGLAASKAPTP